MKKILLLNLLVSCTILSNSKTEYVKDRNIIENNFKIAMDKCTFPERQIEIENIRYKEYDKLLNKYYKRLYSKLDNKMKTKLKSNQKEWLLFRDAQFKFNDKGLYQSYDYQKIANKSVIVRNRVEELVNSLSIKEGDK